MKTIKRYVSLGLTLIRMGWQSQISYMGFSALLSYVAQIIQFASRFGVVWLMMLSFTDLAGFGLWEVLVIFALELFSYALANAFLQPFWRMRDLVFGGEMDFYLVRPVNTLYYIMTKGFAPGYTAHIVLSTVVLVTASVQLGRFTSPGFWLLVILTILVGAGIQFGLICIPAFLTFWFGNVGNLYRLVGRFREFVRYPLSVYPAFIQAICTFLLPYAFINHFPSLLLFEKIGMTEGIVLFCCGILVSALMVALPVWMFSRGLGRYESGNG